jgi:integrase-like protein
VTKLLQRMHDELVRRNYAATTIRTYLHALNLCHRQHPGRRLDRLGPRELRRYQAYLFQERKLAVGVSFRPEGREQPAARRKRE